MCGYYTSQRLEHQCNYLHGDHITDIVWILCRLMYTNELCLILNFTYPNALNLLVYFYKILLIRIYGKNKSE